MECRNYYIQTGKKRRKVEYEISYTFIHKDEIVSHKYKYNKKESFIDRLECSFVEAGDKILLLINPATGYSYPKSRTKPKIQEAIILFLLSMGIGFSGFLFPKTVKSKNIDIHHHKKG